MKLYSHFNKIIWMRCRWLLRWWLAVVSGTIRLRCCAEKLIEPSLAEVGNISVR